MAHMTGVLPKITSAAGVIGPARVLVMGLGVAGLEAIATAQRLGAVVEGYDVRPATKEQALSLQGSGGCPPRLVYNRHRHKCRPVDEKSIDLARHVAGLAGVNNDDRSATTGPMGDQLRNGVELARIAYTCEPCQGAPHDVVGGDNERGNRRRDGGHHRRRGQAVR